MSKPDWREGDWIYRDNGTTKEMMGWGRYCSPHTFIASHDPEPKGAHERAVYDWNYGGRDASSYRKVTVNDVYRLLSIASGDLERVTSEIAKLRECLKQITGDKFDPPEAHTALGSEGRRA